MLLDEKPRVFIGSTTEALDIAQTVKNTLSEIATCIIWNEKVFGFNKTYFETLLEIPNLNDFAILIATKDDKGKSRGKSFETPRDNILFEFGLFLGRLSRRKVFIVEEQGVKIPSDLLGVELPKFTRVPNKPGDIPLEDCCNALKNEIINKSKIFTYSFLPSVALAQGYFNNFVKQVCKGMHSSHTVWLKEEEGPGNVEEYKKDRKVKEWKNFELIIAVPDDLPEDFNAKVQMYTKKYGLSRMEVGTDTRFYNFYLNAKQEPGQSLRVHDMPTTLSGIKTVIEHFVTKDYEGELQIEALLKKREIATFVKTLEFLISQNDYTKNNVRVEIENI